MSTATLTVETPKAVSTGRAFAVVRLVLGVLLLTAAGLKLSGMNVTAVPRVGWLATPRVQVAAAAWELVLGVWLLSGNSAAWAWLTALGTFLTFAGVSGYFGWIGVASCGCFGAIKASPWAAFGVDVAAVGVLGVSRPSFCKGAWRLPAGALNTAGGTVFVVIGTAVIGSFVYGSPRAALAQLRRESLSASPDYIDFGEGRKGMVKEALVEIHNWSDHAVGLIGGTSDCACIATHDLPMHIPPKSSRHVGLTLTLPNSHTGSLTRSAQLRTDCQSQPVICIILTCSIIE